MLETGEVFARLRLDEGASVPLAVDLLDRDQVPADRFGEAGGSRVRAGIEFDQNGRRIAYHVLRERPGDPFAPLTGSPLETVRLPADDCLHLFEEATPGQLRGISRLAPVLLRLKELDEFEDAALVKAKVAALFAGFIVDPSGQTANALAGAPDAAGTAAVGMEPGSMIPLPPGTDIRFSEPKTDAAYDPFIKSHLRAIAAGLGVPYEALTGDLSTVNYSSIRAGMVEFRRNLEALQHNVLVPRFCDPVWKRFVTLAVLSGALDIPGAELTDLFAVEWLPPRFDYVDPQKDVNAEILAINAGLKSRAMAVAERGYDVEAIDAEIAADQERVRRLNISFGQAPAEPRKQEAPNDA
jgi:lambda family phage portal protein